MSPVSAVSEKMCELSTHVKRLLSPRTDFQSQYSPVNNGPVSRPPVAVRTTHLQWVHIQTCVRRTPEEMRRHLRQQLISQRGWSY